MDETVRSRNRNCITHGFLIHPIRLQGCQPDVETWQRVLQVRTLVSAPEEDSTMWIKFANLCRKSDRMVLADKTINSLLASVCLLSLLEAQQTDMALSPLYNIAMHKTSRLPLTSFMPSLSLCGPTTQRTKRSNTFVPLQAISPIISLRLLLPQFRANQQFRLGSWKRCPNF